MESQILLQQGYEHASPSNESFRIDSEVSRDAKCEKCGSTNTSFQPRTKFDSEIKGGYESYRAFIVCECGHESEF